MGSGVTARPNPYDALVDNALAPAAASNSANADGMPLRTRGKKRGRQGRGAREGDNQGSE